MGTDAGDMYLQGATLNLTDANSSNDGELRNEINLEVFGNIHANGASINTNGG
jgi:hypothetical protein